jgi:glycosyltransferase involved in cell wall biosynthesis
MRRILVQGWRFIPHSYALINEFQCLELLRRPDVELFFEDLPFVKPGFQPVHGVFDSASDLLLSNMRPLPPGVVPDAIYRNSFPLDLRPSSSAPAFVFGTVEYGIVPPSFILGGAPLREALRQSDITLIAPANWSRDGFIASGADPKRVAVIPYGIDTRIFRPPSAEVRQTLRQNAGFSDHFVFLHIGTMSENKNVPLLLKAFAVVASRHPHARLALKGLDAIYTSQQQLSEATKLLTQAELALVQPRSKYWGGVFNLEAMSQLFQTADAYVSPYAAEGFNMPALEAIASGLPLICTAGGPTDDFTSPEFALRIDSTIVPVSMGEEMGRKFAVNFDNLVADMIQVIEQPDFCSAARIAGPAFVDRGFALPIVVDKLLKLMFPAR